MLSLFRSAQPPPAPRPARPAPEGACDCHVHLSDASAGGAGFAERIGAWRVQMEAIGLARTILEQPDVEDLETARAIEALGHERTRGIGRIVADADDDAYDALIRDGFEAVRVDGLRDGPLDSAEAMAARLADRGLHVEMSLAAAGDLVALAPRIAALPVPVVLDHMGIPDLDEGPGAPGFRALLALLDQGDVWVKISGLSRLCPPPFSDADPFVAALLSANPLRCLWGSGWPRDQEGPGTDPAALLDAFDRTCPDAETRRAVLVDNPARLYGF